MSPDALLDTLETGILVPFIYFMLALAGLYFIWGVFLFVKNSDNPEAQSKGKQHMIWGVFGLAIMLAVQSIIELIRNTVT